jgi:hypothetical protein
MRKEIESSITKINKFKTESTDLFTIRYDTSGKSDNESFGKFSDDYSTCIVRVNNNGKIFKVKIDKNGKLYNPLNDNNTYGLNKRDKNTKDPIFKFVQVNENCFNLYIKFLKTKQTSFLISAEREI